MSDTTALVTTTAPPPPQDIEVTAQNVDEMEAAQSALIVWCRAKIQQVEQEHKELADAYWHAVKCKWKAETLKRHSDLAAKRADFYRRMLTALEHGYQIVPSFPITAFAVRTNKKKPLRMYTTHWGTSHEQGPAGLPEGCGEYKNPFPVVMQRTYEKATATSSEVVGYWAEMWKELEFPLSMSKPQIMQATTRAMALKIFDQFGILPGFAPNEGTRPPAGDPIIIATMLVPNWAAASKRYVSFVIAWHLNTRDL